MASRVEIEFQESLLKNKKEAFKRFVLLSSAVLGLSKAPKVKFYDGVCSYGSSKGIAHIHVEKGVICISNARLKQMNMDEIEQTATHEVTHMLEHAHDDNFYIKHSKAKLGTWMASTESPKIVKKSKKDKKSKAGDCDYHLCNKKSSKKYRCALCGKTFCKEHSSPKAVSLVKSSFKDDPELSIFFDKEHERLGHPCFPYTIKKVEEIKTKERESYKKLFEALDKSRDKKFIFPDIVGRKFERKPSREKSSIKPILIFISLIIVVYLLVTYNKEILGLFCQPNFEKVYESGASFGRLTPEEYCENTCKEDYNSTEYSLTQTEGVNVCSCDMNNCNP